MKKILPIILNGFSVCLLYDVFIIFLMAFVEKFLKIDLSSIMSQNVASASKMNLSSVDFLIFLPYAALKEEFIFRFLPIVFLLGSLYCFSKKIFINETLKNNFIFIIGIISSIIFGYLHGSYINIMVQGVSGFILFMVWYESYKKSNSFTVATIASTITHLASNAFWIILIMLLHFIIDSIRIR